MLTGPLRLAALRQLFVEEGDHARGGALAAGKHHRQTASQRLRAQVERTEMRQADPKTYQRLPLLWGVTPYLIPQADTVEAMLAHVEAGILYDSPVPAGQQVIVIAGLLPSKMVPANFILLQTVGRS